MIKAISVFLIILLVLNIILFSMKKISGVVFWVTIIIIALIAFKGLDYLKKKNLKN